MVLNKYNKSFFFFFFWLNTVSPTAFQAQETKYNKSYDDRKSYSLKGKHIKGTHIKLYLSATITTNDTDAHDMLIVIKKL